MRQTALALITIATLLFAIAPAFGQHTLAAKFDVTKSQTLTATCTQVDWSNPYGHVLMKVPGNPRPISWAVELDSATTVGKNGWTAAARPLGETVTVQGFTARDGTKQISGNSTTTSTG